MNTKTLNLVLFTLLLALASFPAAAQSTPFQGPIDWLIDVLTGAFARSAAVLVIVVSGYAAWIGKMSWNMAGRIIGGVVLIFGGATIADLIIGEVG